MGCLCNLSSSGSKTQDILARAWDFVLLRSWGAPLVFHTALQATLGPSGPCLTSRAASPSCCAITARPHHRHQTAFLAVKSKTESRIGRPHQVSERGLLFAGNRTPTSKWLKKQRSYFKIERSFWKTMLRYNSHSTKFIILRCTIQCFLVHSRKYAIITINKKSTIYLKNENSMYNLKNNHLPIYLFSYLSISCL